MQPVIDRVFVEEQAERQQPLAVEKLPLQNYYSAEEYHQDYLDKNPTPATAIGNAKNNLLHFGGAPMGHL